MALVSRQRAPEMLCCSAVRKPRTFTAGGSPLWGLLEKLLTPTQAYAESLTCGASFRSETAKAGAVPASQVLHLCREHGNVPSNSSCTWHWNVLHLTAINGLHSFQRKLTKKVFGFGVCLLLCLFVCLGVFLLLSVDRTRNWASPPHMPKDLVGYINP